MGEVQLRERMRLGISDALRRAGGARGLSGTSLVALLCAAALAPVVAAGAMAGSVVLASVGVAGSVGANVLTDLIERVTSRLREDGKADSATAVEAALEAALEKALTGTPEVALALREAVAQLLRAVDAAGAVVEAAAGRDQELLPTVVEGFARLGDQFSEFAFAADEVRQVTWEIRESLRRQMAESRRERHRSRERDLVLLRLQEALERDSTPAQVPAGGSARGEVAWSGCPYPGLRPYEEQDAQVFYGRRALVEKLVQHLGECLDSGEVVLVVGASGAGKSSLLQAGLLPEIAAGAFGPGSGSWPRLVVQAEGSPLKDLALGLAEITGADPVAAYESLLASPDKAPVLIEQVVRSSAGTRRHFRVAGRSELVQGRLVLVVDQFERLFTLTAESAAARAERDAFVTVLGAAAAAPASPEAGPVALVVVAIRGDCLEQAITYPPVAAAAEAGVFAVPPMTEAELRQAITGPAAEAGLAIDDDLADTVIGELRSTDGSRDPGAGVLPLLSQAMAGTWEHREASRLSIRAYRRAGGVSDAVNRSAQDAYNALAGSQKDAARLVFTRLTVITAEGRLERRRVSLAELHDGSGRADASDVDAVVSAFSVRRLLVLDEVGAEIAHDILLRSWKQLSDWLSDDQVGRALYSRVVADARVWQASTRDPSYLYRPGRLDAVTEAAARWASSPERYEPLPAVATEFLSGARAVAARTRRSRRAGAASLVMLTLAAVIFAAAAVNNGTAAARDARAAGRQREMAVSGELTARSVTADRGDPVRARQLAIAAARVFPTSLAQSDISSQITEQQMDGFLPVSAGSVTAVAFSPDGGLLATADTIGIVRLWNRTTGRPVAPPIRMKSVDAGGDVNAIAFSPDGRKIALVDEGGFLGFWNPATGHRDGKEILADRAKAVRELAFSPDGAQVATGGESGTVRLWNAATGRPAGVPIHLAAAVTGLAYSPRGGLLATADFNGMVQFWNPATGRPAAPALPGGAAGQMLVAFSPTGRLLATQDGNGVLRIWDLPAGRLALPAIRTGSESPGGLAFSPDGRLLATTDLNGEGHFWNPTDGHPAGQPFPAGTTVQSAGAGLAFNPGGTILATADDDGTVRFWTPPSGLPAGAALPVTLPVTPDELFVATGTHGIPVAITNNDGSAQIWSLTTGQPIGKPASTGRGEIIGAALSPGGRLLIVIEGGGTVQVRDATTRKRTGVPLRTGINAIETVAFSPDRNLLATAYEDGAIKVWNLATGRLAIPALRDGPIGATGLAFSHDGRLIAAVGIRAGIRVWSTSTGRPTRANFHSNASGPGIAFSPDGKLLAAATAQGLIQFWNPSTGRPIGVPIAADPVVGFDTVGISVAFTPDGSMLATAAEDGTAQIWNVSMFTEPYRALCAEVGLPPSPDWQELAPGQREPATCA